MFSRFTYAVACTADVATIANRRLCLAVVQVNAFQPEFLFQAEMVVNSDSAVEVVRQKRQ